MEPRQKTQIILVRVRR